MIRDRCRLWSYRVYIKLSLFFKLLHLCVLLFCATGTCLVNKDVYIKVNVRSHRMRIALRCVAVARGATRRRVL